MHHCTVHNTTYKHTVLFNVLVYLKLSSAILLSSFTEAYCILFMCHNCGHIITHPCECYYGITVVLHKRASDAKENLDEQVGGKLACPLREQTIQNGASGCQSPTRW